MSEDKEVSRSRSRRLSRRTLLRLGLLAVPAAQMPLGIVPGAAAQGTKLGANLIGKLEGAEVVTDPALYPKSFKEAPRSPSWSRPASSRPSQERIGQDPLVVKPLREIGKYGGTWRRGFTGPFDTSNGHRAAQNDKLLYCDYTGTKIVPNIARAWEVSPDGKVTTLSLRRGMKWSDGQPFTADDFVFWYQDMYLNKELVPDAALGDDDQRQAHRHREGRRDHHPVRLAGAVLRAAHRARVGVGHRAPRALRTRRARRLRARSLPEAVPSEVRLEGRAREEAGRAEVRQLGHDVQEPERRVPQPGPARGDAVEDDVAPHHADLDPRAQSLQRVGRHRRQPAPVHRPDPHDARREPRGHQPAGDRRRVRLAGAAHRHQQAAGAAREPAEGRLPRATSIPRTRAPTSGSSATRATTRTRRSPSGSAPASSASRCPTASTASRSTRPSCSVSARPARPRRASGRPTSPGPEYKTLHAAYDVKKANEMLDKLGLTKKDGEGYRLRADGGGRLRLALTTYVGFLPFTQIAEMIVEQWKKIGIRGEVQEMERGAGHGPGAGQRAPDLLRDPVGRRQHLRALPVDLSRRRHEPAGAALRHLVLERGGQGQDAARRACAS